jgi:hypothetical protein
MESFDFLIRVFLTRIPDLVFLAPFILDILSGRVMAKSFPLPLRWRCVLWDLRQSPLDPVSAPA